MTRAFSYDKAIAAGLEPRDYDWQHPPEGSWIGRLDFKVWGQAANLVCYFTEISTGRKFRLSAFRPKTRTGSRYAPRDGAIDFSAEGIDGQAYRLQTGLNPKGNPAWFSAEQIETPTEPT